MKKTKYLIIGGVAGGASAAARLRRNDETAEIILIERDQDVSYANCGLPYYLGGVIPDRTSLNVASPELLQVRFGIDVRTQTEAMNIDSAGHLVELKDLKTGRTYSESYTKLLIATGSRAFIPSIPGIDSPGIFALKTLGDTDKAKSYYDANHPKSITIIGGGPIGIELADSYVELGLDVHLLEHSPQILNMFDIELAQKLTSHLREKGVDVRTKTSVKEIISDSGGMTLNLSEGESVRSEMIFVVAGVRPESGLAVSAKLKTLPTGAIEVDRYLATSSEDIYAVGDVIAVTELVTNTEQTIALAGPANKQGRIAADNMSGQPHDYNGALASSILKVGDLTAASTGLNESQAKKAGLDYLSATIHSLDHAGYYPGAQPLTLKLIFQADGTIIGAQSVGHSGADKRIDVIATAIRGRLKIDDLAELDLCYAPPYSSAKDPVNMVAFVAQNILSGRMKPMYAADLDELDLSDWYVLDVRTQAERRKGFISGSQLITLDELRNNLESMNKAKKILVYCASGLRSYVASRILTQNGFDAYSLMGGYKTYFDFNHYDNAETRPAKP